MNWQERIIERFKEEFGDKIHQLVMLDHEGSKPVGTAREIADLYSQEIDEFLLQEGEKIRREAIEEVREKITKWQYASVHRNIHCAEERSKVINDIFKYLKSDGEEEK